MTPTTDAIIVGGGIVGCFAAYRLASEGVGVLLLDRAEVGGGQSGQNWGFVRRQGRDPIELPLAEASLRVWRGLEEETGSSIQWVPGGNIRVAATQQQLADYQSWLVEARGSEFGARIIDGQELDALLPQMKVRWPGALYTPDDGHVEPRQATEAVAAAATRAGAKIETGTTVIGFLRTGEHIVGVRTTRGDISSGTVVCAAGIWSSRLLRTIGLKLPIRWVRATVASTTPVPPLTDLGVWTPDVSFRQRRDGSLLLGGGGGYDHDITLESIRFLSLFLPNYAKNRRLFRFRFGAAFFEELALRFPIPRRRWPYDWRRAAEPPANSSRVAVSQRGLVRLFPELAGRFDISKSWAGYIDATPDALPVIAPVRSYPGLIAATGFSGHGFALGPGAGQVVSDMVLNRPPSIDVSALGFERFGGGSRIRARAVT